MSILGRSLWFAVGGAPVFINSAKASTTATTLVISKPTNTAQGDIMVVFLCASTAKTWTGDAGWTEVVDQGVSPSVRIAYLVAGASEPSSYTFTPSAIASISGVIVTYRNASYDTIGVVTTTSPTVAPQITVASNNSILLAFYALDTSPVVYSTPTGMAPVNSEGGASAPNWALFSENVSAGATGTRTSTPNQAGGDGGVLLSLKPG